MGDVLPGLAAVVACLVGVTGVLALAVRLEDTLGAPRRRRAPLRWRLPAARRHAAVVSEPLAR